MMTSICRNFTWAIGNLLVVWGAGVGALDSGTNPENPWPAIVGGTVLLVVGIAWRRLDGSLDPKLRSPK